MNKPDLAGSTPEARQRQAAAELLGRILAAHWLRRPRPTTEAPPVSERLRKPS